MTQSLRIRLSKSGWCTYLSIDGIIPCALQNAISPDRGRNYRGRTSPWSASLGHLLVGCSRVVLNRPSRCPMTRTLLTCGVGLEPHAQISALGYQNDTTTDNAAASNELPVHGLGYVLAGCRKRVALRPFFDDVLDNRQRLVFGSLNSRMASFSPRHKRAQWPPSEVVALRASATEYGQRSACVVKVQVRSGTTERVVPDFIAHFTSVSPYRCLQILHSGVTLSSPQTHPVYSGPFL